MSEIGSTPEEVVDKLQQNVDSNSYRESNLNTVAERLEGERYDEFLEEAKNACDNVANNLSELEFNQDDNILIIVSGKSSAIAENIWQPVAERLPNDNPIKTRGKVMKLGDMENAALYGKYDEESAKYEQQQELMGAGYSYLLEMAMEQGLIEQSDKKPKIILFEEYSNTESKSLNGVSNLRKNGYESYAVVLSGMSEADRDYFRQSQDIQLPEDADEINKYLFVGSRDSKLHNVMYRLASARSSHAEDVINDSTQINPSDRAKRQASRDLVRKISADLAVD